MFNLSLPPFPSPFLINHRNNAKTHKKIIEFALQEVNGDHDKLLTQDVLYGRKLSVYTTHTTTAKCANA